MKAKPTRETQTVLPFARDDFHAYLLERGLETFAHERGTAYRMPVSTRATGHVRARDLTPKRRRAVAERLARLGAPPPAGDEEFLEATITTRDLDRYGDIVETSGARVADYLRNPVVLWAHKATQPPVGVCVELEVSKTGIRALTRFSRATALAREVAALYREGALHAFSIGFLPDMAKVERVTLGDGRQGYRFLEWDLLEYSCVAVPANPNALVSAVKKGLASDSLREAMLRALGKPEADAVRSKLRLERNEPPEGEPHEYWKREAKRAFTERDRERAQRRLLESLLREVQRELIAEVGGEIGPSSPRQETRETPGRPEGRPGSPGRLAPPESIPLDEQGTQLLRREIALVLADEEARLARLAENEIARQAGSLPRTG